MHFRSSERLLWQQRRIVSVWFLSVAVLCNYKANAAALLLPRRVVALPVYLVPSMSTATPDIKELQVEVWMCSNSSVITRSESDIGIQTNFEAHAPLSGNNKLVIALINERGESEVQIENDLNNYLTILPTNRWMGPVAISSMMRLPKLANGIYSIRVSLLGADGPIQMKPGPGVTQDTSLRYSVGTVKIAASAPPAKLLTGGQLDLTGYHITFDEPFSTLSISDSARNDGARWYARNEECCMSTTDGTSTAMAGVSMPQNPFSKLPGNGLNIRLQRIGDSWTSGVLTSVDGSGNGFSQQYGYFEMKAKFPKGENTWPAFWLLNTASKTHHVAPTGEIDIVEYIANAGFPHNIATTLHDWSNNTAPAASHYQVPLPTDGFHTYGMMWTDRTMTFYVDGSITFRAPTPAVMQQPYYLLVDLGIGSGYPTDKTPNVNDMQIQSIRVYAKD